MTREGTCQSQQSRTLRLDADSKQWLYLKHGNINKNAFRVTGPLLGNSSDTGGFPESARITGFDAFFYVCLSNYWKTVGSLVIQGDVTLLLRQCNICVYKNAWGMCQLTMCLTHWGRVKHICVSKLIIIGSDNALSLGRCKAFTLANAAILIIRTLGTTFSEILKDIYKFSFNKCSSNVVCAMAAILYRHHCVKL